MLTLQQAVQSGKEFTRKSALDAGDVAYYSAEDFVASLDIEDVTATDYVLKPDVLTVGLLAGIWNTNKAAETPSAVNSKFFGKMVAALRTAGLIKEA